MAIPYRFTPDVIKSVVPKNVIGTYALGNDEQGQFSIKYVGRSDISLRKRLLTHNYLFKYSYFIFFCTKTKYVAFIIESKWWHDCKNSNEQLVNVIHPDSPSQMNVVCPYCQFKMSIRDIIPNIKAG